MSLGCMTPHIKFGEAASIRLRLSKFEDSLPLTHVYLSPVLSFIMFLASESKNNREVNSLYNPNLVPLYFAADIE
jgi:hypothetical protein